MRRAHRKSKIDKPLFDRWPDLAVLPIKNPQREKTFLKSGTLLAYLAPAGRGQIHPSAYSSRIVEIYRRCYEQERIEKRNSILEDFVASFPQLVLQANWIREVVKKSFTNESSGLNETLLSIGKGFRKAADPAQRRDKLITQVRLEAARESQKTFSKNLVSWNRGLKRRDALHGSCEWIREESKRKVTELVTEDPKLKPVEWKLIELLVEGLFYEASIIMAAQIFEVPRRRLERKEK